ncbi:50S ribosomal protein L25 [Candidatus Woesebacteria bacterium]|nr:50S ribosomal protein L25 [Candidatus Woesebacteria bacterium]
MTKSKNTVLHVRLREITGKKSRKLQKSGYISANIYGLKEASENIEVEVKALEKMIAAHGDTTLLYLQVGESKQSPSLIDEIQYNPVTDKPIHVSFKRVNLNVKVTAEIPVEMIGEVEIPQATVILTRNVLEVEALPADLPEKFEVSISDLKEIGDSLFLADIAYDRSKITVVMSDEDKENSPIVLVQEVEEEVAETTESTEDAAASTTPAAAETDSAKAEEAADSEKKE